MDPTPMAAFLSDVASIVTQILTWVTSVGTTIVGSPMLLFTVGFLALGKLHAAQYKPDNIGKNLFVDNTEIIPVIA